MATVDWHALDRQGRVSYGLVRQRETGLSKDQLRRARAKGIVADAQSGVLRLAGTSPTPEQQLLAAVWSAGGIAAASHRCAAVLWGLLIDWPDCPEICVPPNRRPRLRNVIVHRSDALVPDVISMVRLIPITNPLLTLIQLGSVVEPTLVAEGLERGLIKRLFTMNGLRQTLDNYGRSGRDGAGVLRAVIAERALGDDRPESLLETKTATIFDQYGLPQPTFQYVVFDGKRFIARVDFAYPKLRIAFEVDGWSVHGTSKATRLDFERQNELEHLGWLVLRFTWYDVVRRPAYVAEHIARVLRTHRSA